MKIEELIVQFYNLENYIINRLKLLMFLILFFVIYSNEYIYIFKFLELPKKKKTHLLGKDCTKPDSPRGRIGLANLVLHWQFIKGVVNS